MAGTALLFFAGKAEVVHLTRFHKGFGGEYCLAGSTPSRSPDRAASASQGRRYDLFFAAGPGRNGVMIFFSAGPGRHGVMIFFAAGPGRDGVMILFSRAGLAGTAL